MLPTGVLTSHEVIQLHRKDRWAGPHAAARGSSPASGEDEDLGAPSAETGAAAEGAGGRNLGWAGKLTKKLKQLFCFQ